MSLSEYFFANRKQVDFLGSSSIDKKPWQQLVMVAHRINRKLMDDGTTDEPFFNIKYGRKPFINKIYRLANPNLDKPKGGESFSMETIKAYIDMKFQQPL